MLLVMTYRLDQHRPVCNSSSEHSRARIYPLSPLDMSRDITHSTMLAPACIQLNSHSQSRISLLLLLHFRRSSVSRFCAILSFFRATLEKHWDFKAHLKLDSPLVIRVPRDSLAHSLVAGISRWLRRIVVSTESTNTCRSMCCRLIIRTRRKRQLSLVFFRRPVHASYSRLYCRLDAGLRKEARCRRDRVRNVKRQHATRR